MKIFYTSSVNGIDQDLDQICPFRQRSEKTGGLMYVGSLACKSCKYCYGYGQHPNEFHKLAVIPFYSRNTKETRDKADFELPEYSLKDCKFISEDDYIKCMKCFSEIGQKKRKNRFKLWYWKHIGENLSYARYWIIKTYNDIKVKIIMKLHGC